MKASFSSPKSVCIRVTRGCNASCGFCLAPPDGIDIPTNALVQRLRWVADNGFSSIMFCGGEPTVRHDLPQLLYCARSYGLRLKLTTNGILISDDLVQALARTQTQVKISVHGPREVHDDFLGVVCFDRIVDNIDRILKSRVYLGIQTIVTSRYSGAIDFAVDFCLQRGIRKVSFVPFIPRGRGRETETVYGLTAEAKASMRDYALDLREQLRSQLDVRWLDFAVREYVVVETNGQVAIQRETDEQDSLLWTT